MNIHGKDIKIFTGNSNKELAVSIAECLGLPLGKSEIGMLVTVVLIIAGFSYYVSVAQGLSFKKRFGEMALISLSVAVISFIIGLIVKQCLGIDL